MARRKNQADGAQASLGGKRTEIVSVRIDPKLKYLAELAARKQRRSLSGYIEWMLERSLEQVSLYEGGSDDESVSVADAERLHKLWDVDEADRVIKLALHHPELLTYEEQLIWKLVRENGFIWRGHYHKGEWAWIVQEKSLIWDRLRKHWHIFKKVAAGGEAFAELPKWLKSEQTDPSDYGEEIPF